MNEQARGWVEILSDNDAEAVWAKLFRLVSRHSAIRNLFDPRSNGHDRPQELFTDITQDLFLKLHRKHRWQHYLDAGYSNAEIDHEMYHIEIPNLVSLLLRERHPEAYRMARRVSNLVQTSPEFRRYRTGAASGQEGRRGKMTLKVYGLREWPDDKPIKPYQIMHGLIEDVCFRARDRRRAGRGGNSHIIISSNDLTELLVEIFSAIDSPADVRMMRSLVMSKLPIEDSSFVSIEAALAPDSTDSEPLKVDFADQRPTPEEIVLDNESMQQVEAISEQVLEKMRHAVRNKPNRYTRLARVAWHCYFDTSSPSQTSIAQMIGISNSLVSHYRKLFDNVVRGVDLDAEQYVPFIHTFSANLEASIREPIQARDDGKEFRDSALLSVPKPYPMMSLAAAASSI